MIENRWLKIVQGDVHASKLRLRCQLAGSQGMINTEASALLDELST